jgi:transposase-like protein
MNDNFHKGAVKEERQIYSYDDSPNDDGSDSGESRGDEGRDDHKSKKKYSVIPQSVREKFIKRVLSKEVTIKEAAKEFGLKFSTSKAILQTYKKEGRIGKKKNRERKTKVVNVVFVCNINSMNPYQSNIFPIVSVNEVKGSKNEPEVEENKNKLLEHTMLNYPEHKIVHQTNLQIPNDSTKSTHQFIKDLGNEFLKDFIEKNFGGKIPPPNQLNGTLNTHSISNNVNLPSTQNSTNLGNTSNMGGSMNLNGLSNMPPPHLNGMSNLGNNPYIMSQQFNMSTDMPQMMGQNLGQLNQPSPNQMNHMSFNAKRSFQTYERDTIPELELKNEQITEMSVKKFKSGEDVLWDYDMDRSKKDLEDFIYKTHNAIKNNTYIQKTVTFDFSKYKDDFAE